MRKVFSFIVFALLCAELLYLVAIHEWVAAINAFFAIIFFSYGASACALYIRGERAKKQSSVMWKVLSISSTRWLLHPRRIATTCPTQRKTLLRTHHPLLLTTMSTTSRTPKPVKQTIFVLIKIKNNHTWLSLFYRVFAVSPSKGWRFFIATVP